MLSLHERDNAVLVAAFRQNLFAREAMDGGGYHLASQSDYWVLSRSCS
jgi:hypothetical protein